MTLVQPTFSNARSSLYGCPPGAARTRAREAPGSPDEGVILRVLGREVALTDEEYALVRRFSVFRGGIPAGQPFWRDGQAVSARVIVSGWACRQRCLPDGRRQIFGFLIPGDTVGLCAEHRPLDEVSTVALTRVECMDALLLREILATHDARHARLEAALAAARRQEERWLLDHVVRLGRQSALERSAHLFLELSNRCETAGLDVGGRFPVPLTQEVLADALGLSIVHLHRTLQQMRRGGLIEFRSGWLTILNRTKLEAIADFGPHDS